jgi:predicted NAD-dependent protein-ADP-ribosyltransferase YbiA (DUF1768 family)
MTDTLFFYSKSADRPVGKGVNEFVANPDEYSELESINNWRKILSNFYFAPFVYDNRTYNTIEHAFQAERIRQFDQEKAYMFSVESDHFIGRGDGLVARQNGKRIIPNDIEQSSQWNDIKYTVLYHLLIAKFIQVRIARKALILTRSAVLLHRSSRGGSIQQQLQLEKVRSVLKKLRCRL